MVKQKSLPLRTLVNTRGRTGAGWGDGGSAETKNLHHRGLGASGIARGMGDLPVLTGCMSEGADWWIFLDLLLL